MGQARSEGKNKGGESLSPHHQLGWCYHCTLPVLPAAAGDTSTSHSIHFHQVSGLTPLSWSLWYLILMLQKGCVCVYMSVLCIYEMKCVF